MAKVPNPQETDAALPIEQRIAELEAQAEKAKDPAERERLEAQISELRANEPGEISPWERVQIARHGQRPRMLDYVGRLLDDFVELHGDRAIGDDPAMVGGIGRFQGETIIVAGQQKGVTTEEKVKRNFGMAHPEGYRKALRLMDLAERFRLPMVTFVDTPAAHPGPEAEQHGQGPAIARNLWRLMGIKTPVYCAVLAEGGSGGALGIAVGDYIAMYENAIYVICPPERCAEILWRDPERKELAASVMRVTAEDLMRLGVIDEILPEPGGGAHRNPAGAADSLARSLERFLAEAKEGKWTVEKRQTRFRTMGVFQGAESGS